MPRSKVQAPPLLCTYCTFRATYYRGLASPYSPSQFPQFATIRLGLHRLEPSQPPACSSPLDAGSAHQGVGFPRFPRVSGGCMTVMVAIRNRAARVRRNCSGASFSFQYLCPCIPSHPRPRIIKVAVVVFRTARTMPHLSSHPPAPAPARTSSPRNSCLIAFIVHRQTRKNRQS